MNALTFNAPAVGWLFTKPELMEKDEDEDGVNEYVFDYPKKDSKRTDLLRNAPVINYGMSENPIFRDNRLLYGIGNSVYLSKTEGKLKYVEDGKVNWHSTDAIELALHDAKPCPKCGALPCECDNTPPPPEEVEQFCEPLIIDLDRDGKVSTSGNKRFFDLDANGVIEEVSWAAPGDGLLVLDRDGDGIITSGEELFGDRTPLKDGRIASSGFKALADLDSNSDGVIDAHDEQFQDLRVWADNNGDGVFGDDELYSLEEVGIESIDLRYVEQNITDENGNLIVATGKVTWSDGDTGLISEFFLQRSTINGIYEQLPVSEDIASLPNIDGRGYLYSLHQAMVRDASGELKELVERFVATDDPVIRRGLFDNILLKWGALSDMQEVREKDWLGFMAKFYGRDTTIGRPTENGWRQLRMNYESLSVWLYGHMLLESHYSYIGNDLKFYENNEGELVLNISNALEEIAKGYADDPDRARRSISEYFLVLKTAGYFHYLDDEDISTMSAMLSTYGSELVDVCQASYVAMQYPSGQFTLPSFAGPAGGLLDGGDLNNILVGGDGHDTINGGYGADILMGGRGDDVLNGGHESDIYIWNLGDGNDSIINSTGASGEVDVLRIGEGVHPDNVKLERYGNTIRLVIGESGEILTLATDTSVGGSNSHYRDPNLQIARVEFADGTVWNREYMHGILMAFTGTDERETMQGSSGDDQIEGSGGDDVLDGGYGSDTYVWNLGDGNDTIIEQRFRTDVNRLQIGGVDPASVRFIREGDNLVLVMGEDGERITLTKWYGQRNDDNHRLHFIEFDDGTAWTPEAMALFPVESMVITGTDGDDILDGLSGSDFIQGLKGNDLLRGGAGGDTYVWNLGDGNDTILDRVNGTDENILRFGEGIDRSMLQFRRNGDTVYIHVKDPDDKTGEMITISKWDDVVNHKLARIEFADGSVLSTEEIDRILGQYVTGTDESEILYGSDNYIRTLEGKEGDDMLHGGAAGNTYVWNLGDGNDTIFNGYFYLFPTANAESRLVFGRGISSESLSIKAFENSLIVTVRETGEVITISDWFIDRWSRLDYFEFYDGTVWTMKDIERAREKEIIGTDRNDTIKGHASNDIIIGGKGNDLLLGEKGDDVYVWNPGDGSDIIRDVFGQNVLRFGPGVRPSDLRVAAEGENLVIFIGNTKERITLDRWFVNHQRELISVEFADGTILTAANLEASLDKTILGTDRDDILYGYEWDDVIIGGKGNDIMTGGKSSDTYVWNLGDGNDIIRDGANTSTVDRVQFGAGVQPEDLHLRRHEYDLVVTVTSSDETITFTDWFQTGSFRKYGNSFEFLFENGELWNSATIESNIDRVIYGTEEDDTLFGTPGDDIIYGLGGNDFISAGTGDDVIAGGEGNDSLRGGSGADTFLWELGDGNDTVLESWGEANRLKFGNGIDPADIKVNRTKGYQGDHLVLTIGESGETITFSQWYGRSNPRIAIEFADGTIWDAVDLGMRLNKEYIGTDGNDSLSGFNIDETFIGGKGDDTLYGNGGDDTYIWNLGDGNDTIYDKSSGKGTLIFGEGIDPANIVVQSRGDNLIFIVGKTGEKITVAGWRNNYDNMLAWVKFADGTLWNAADIDDSVVIGTDGADYLPGSVKNETLIGGKGDDTLEGSTGSDTYIWNLGDGNDTIVDRAGSGDTNVLRFGEGVDPAGIKILANGRDLIFVVGETGEQIRVKEWRANDAFRLYRIEFADGTSWRASEVNSNVLEGTDGDDTLTGVHYDETLIGGKGDDMLLGGGGDDIYIWNPGDGNDIISDNTGANVLNIGEGIDPDQVKLIRQQNGLVFEFLETGERVTVQNWFSGSRNQLYQVRFAEGTVWDKNAISQMVANIVGTDDDDTLEGTENDDVIAGLGGNDLLAGGPGGDIYEWNVGDGNDRIRDSEGENIISFGPDVDPSDIVRGMEGSNLVLFCSKTGERITVENCFDKGLITSAYPRVVFADGTIWWRSFDRRDMTVFGTDGDDEVCNYYYRNEGWRRTTYIGGKGDDRIVAGILSRDTFIWNLGDGNDSILVDSDDNDDVLKLGEGVVPSEVHVSRAGENGMNLRLHIEKTGESITLERWFSAHYYQLPVSFADGTLWTPDQITAMRPTYKGEDGDDTLIGYDVNETFEGGKGNDTIDAKGGDDILVGGEGDDYLDGGVGHDTYIWNLGDGNDIIRDSHNDGVLRLGEGISADGVTVSLRGGHVLLSVQESGEVLQLQSRLNRIEFTDGTTWSWDDVLAFTGPSTVMGTDGDDELEGSILGDTLIGGRGDDIIRGGDGDDTYVWNLGDGYDTIFDNVGLNVLEFGEGVAPAGVSTAVEGSDLIFTIAATGERIRVEGWRDARENWFSEVRFADGTVWTGEDVRDRTPNIEIEGVDGVDEWGYGDWLEGTIMNDTITGRAGGDELHGGEGDDVYVWNLGDGDDWIYDTQGKNTLRLGPGISRENLSVEPDVTDPTPISMRLIAPMSIDMGIIYATGGIAIVVGETGERIRIANWREALANGDFKLVLDDGTTLTSTDLDALMTPIRGTAGDDSIRGHEYGDVIEGLVGNDFINGRGGDDTLIGGEGNDDLDGETGDDTLIGGTGYDRLNGGEGNDVFIWNLGDGNDWIRDFGARDFNVLQFGEGVSRSDVRFAYGSSDFLGNRDLQVIIGDDGNESVITVTRYNNYYGESEVYPYGIHEIRFADGSVISSEELIGLEIDPTIIQGSPGNDGLGGTTADDTFIGGRGDDILEDNHANSNDTYIWNLGDGHDEIWDYSGNNVLKFGEGVSPEDVKPIRVDEWSLRLVIGTGGEGSVLLRDWPADRQYEDYLFGEIHFHDGTVWTHATISEMTLEIVEATEGDDLILGTQQDDVLHGLGGNDVIRGLGGNDTLVGDKGGDFLYGGEGDDTYLWTVGDGCDLIVDNQGDNNLRIDGVEDMRKVRVERSGDDLVLHIGYEFITVKDWMLDPANQLLEIRFGDIVVWDREYLNDALNEIVGTGENDVLEGRDSNNETLIGLGGDDVLKGGRGNDTYVWNVGDGNDLIIDDLGDNVLYFGDSVSPESVKIEREDRHLNFIIGDERIQVQNWFQSNSKKPLSEVRFANGSTWTVDQVDRIAREIHGTDDIDTLKGFPQIDDILIGHEGDDVLYGGSGGKDTFIWNVGDGNDRILDASLSDILQMGVDRESVRYERDENHLYIIADEERITIEGWFSNKHQLKYILFADGKIMTYDMINNMLTTFTGTDGDDELYGYNSSGDTLEGKGGDDVLYGGGGSDTYIWNLGDGNDRVVDGQGYNTVQFGKTVMPNMVRLERDTDNLYVIIGGERITMENWFVTSTSGARTFYFGNGSKWFEETIRAKVCSIVGTEGDDVLNGYDNTGDTLNGLTGNDILSGGKGGDAYIWNIGDGNDIIRDNGGNNILLFGDEIYSSHVRLERDVSNLYLVIGEERITLADWFGDPTNVNFKVQFFDGVVWEKADINAKLGITGDLSEDIVVRGGLGNDKLWGNSRSNRIYGGDGDDHIEGGRGDDLLYGEGGDDTYLWNIGDGNDTILDAKGFNVLDFGADIAPRDVKATRDNRHLYLTYEPTGERIKIESWYAGTSNELGEVHFADGTVWSGEFLNGLLAPIEGTEGDDSILGFDTDDTILGHGGDDIISGRGGDDVLIGGEGDDKLYGGAGDDVYVWERGHGSDTIGDSEGANVLRIGEGVLPGAMTATRDANNLYLHVGGSGETICLENWFRSEGNRSFSMEFADGTVWNAEEIAGLLDGPASEATEGDDILHGTEDDDVIDGLGGDDTIYGGDGDDLVIGNAGRDVLHGEGGNDTYFWNLGDGNDKIIDSQGANRLEFGTGISWSMVTAVVYGMDLALVIGESGEYIRIVDWFKDEANKLSEIAFSDGTVWAPEEIDAKINVIRGTAAPETLSGTSGGDLIIGEAGNDRLIGNAGNDSLIGGTGNDTLEGGAGDDSYIWNLGDGNDAISDYSGNNILQFGEGIVADEVDIQRSGSDLAFVARSTGERIMVRNWYSNNAAWKLAEIRFEDGTVWTRAQVDAMQSTLRGTEAGETIAGSPSDDLIYGNGGDDKIYGYAGKDTLVGGTGNDYLDGGAGDDTYIWNLGDGSDTIFDNTTGVDVLKLGEGITADDVTIERAGENDIVFVIKETGERITVSNWFAGNNYQLARLEFADGTVWTRVDINAMNSAVHGSEGDDILYGTYINDTLSGYGGNDKLYGYAGKDTLTGGTGDDYLDGGAGDDTYVWNLGDGSDTIFDKEGSNVLEIGEGITPNDVTFQRDGNSLVFVIGESQERVTVKDWYLSENHKLSEIRFADGTVWTKEDLRDLRFTYEGTPGDDVLTGSLSGDDLFGHEGADRLSGGAGDDAFAGGAGDDYLDGGAGDDTFIWDLGDGNDMVFDRDGSNFLQIGEGVSPDLITFQRDGNNLVFVIGESQERIAIRDWYLGENYQLAGVRFADETVWSREDLQDIRFTYDGTHENDELTGSVSHDDIYGREGDDRLSGNAGDDVLTGGLGDDHLDGGLGDDTYVWNLGDGDDTIYDRFGANALQLGEGVDPSDISAQLTGEDDRDLTIMVGATGEQITISGWGRTESARNTEIRFSDGTVWGTAYLEGLFSEVVVPDSDDLIEGTVGDDILHGYGGNDTIYGRAGNDMLDGGDGDDSLYGEAGNDTLVGGAGNDALDGGIGNDKYVWNPGDGDDTIVDASGTNVLEIGEGVSGERIEIMRSGNDLILRAAETGERITVKNWYYSGSYQLAEIRFADGTVMTAAAINGEKPIIAAPEGGGTVNGSNSNDIITGSASNDTLNGGAGNDTIIGGKGDDVIEGGSGDDTYIWNLGDGNDTINDYDYRKLNNGVTGTLEIGEGVDPTSVELTREGYNAVIIIGESGERITIKDWYYSSDYQLTQIKFADGTVWTTVDVNAMSPILRAPAEGGTVNGTTSSDTLIGNSGNDTLNGGAGNDKFIGGAGSDHLSGDAGSDTYIWNLGDGNDTINDYDYRKLSNGVTGTLEIGEGVDPASVELTREGNNAVFIIGESGERITIKDWYYSSDYQLTQIKFSDGTVWTAADVNAMSPTYRAPEEGDTINGSSSSDTLIGSSGGDTLNGGAGNDLLNGGKGKDYLSGDAGNDTYVWKLGDGNDTIYDYDYKKLNNGITGTLEIGDGVDPANVELTREGNNAVFIIGESDERITVKDWYYSSDYQLTQIKFADGTVWTAVDVNAMSPIFRATEEGGTVNGSASSDMLYGNVGNDTLNGGAGNDRLMGNAGNDTLNGYVGDDLLIGGIGDDTLNGDAGSDTYIWNLGDGNDTIYDYENKKFVNGRVDILEFGEGVSPEDVELTRVGINAVLIVKTSGERITIKEWYGNENCQLAKISFADGTTWTRANVNAMSPIFRAPEEGGTVNGSVSNDTLYGSVANDTLNGGAGDDRFIGGAGDDYLNGDIGSDTYIWNLGDGNDTIYDYENKKFANGRVDVLELGEGVSPEGIELTRAGNNVVLIVKESGERITIKDWYGNENCQLAQINFADGTTWTREEVNAMSPVHRAPEEGGTVNGSPSNDTLYGSAGSDTLNAGAGNDVLLGDDGNDTLNAGDGNDRLIGGMGDDYLSGDAGSDTYIWNLGDGSDTIYDYENRKFANGRIDVLELGEGVNPEGIELTRVGYNVVLIVKESGERITIRDWYATEYAQLAEIRFKGGSVWTRQDINAMSPIFRAPEEGGTVNGSVSNDTLYGSVANDTLNGAAGDDKFIGGAGDDYLNGDIGSDTYIWNLGDGNDTIYDYENRKFTYGRVDVLELGEGVAPEDVELTRVGYNVVLIVKESGERITIRDWYANENAQLAQIKFADGTIWTRTDINVMSPILRAPETGGTVNGTTSHDTMIGSSANDTLNGSTGNDTLIGNVGDDTLNGGAGSDVYVWNLGDGNDTIDDYESRKLTYGYTGTLGFGEGVNAEDLQLSKVGYNLVILVPETGEQVTVKDWYRGVDYKLTNICFADGTVWTTSDVDEIAAGTKAPFSNPADPEMTRAMSVLSAPSSLLDGVDEIWGRWAKGAHTPAASASSPSNWSYDPALAGIMNGADVSSTSDFDQARLNTDIALAQLNFGILPKEQACDIANAMSPTATSPGVFCAQGNGLTRAQNLLERDRA